jgi:hypothetical protein
MRTFATQAVRKLLRDNPDGLEVNTIASNLERDSDSIRRVLHTMPDAYIDRWVLYGKTGMPSAVWCVVVPPKNCPRPASKRKKSNDTSTESI